MKTLPVFQVRATSRLCFPWLCNAHNKPQARFCRSVAAVFEGGGKGAAAAAATATAAIEAAMQHTTELRVRWNLYSSHNCK
jgi:hypothetical protein